jgi:hypothetical protein
VIIHDEPHMEDEAASAVGRSVTRADGFPCGWRRGVMAELRCSQMTATAVAEAEANGKESRVGWQFGSS